MTSAMGTVWLVISAAAYGTNVVLIKGAIGAGISALTALPLYFALAAILWWLTLLLRRGMVWPGYKCAAQAMVLGGLVYAPSTFTFYQGAERVSGTVASVAFALVPLITAVLAWLLFREKLGLVGKLALALAMAGVVLLSAGPTGRVDPVGLLWLGASAFLVALYFVLSAPLSRTLSPMMLTAYMTSGATVFFLAWSGLSGGIDLDFDPMGWIFIVGLAVLPTFIGVYTFMLGVGSVGATRSSIISVLETVISMVLAVIILTERPGLVQIAGGVLVIVASVLVQLDRGQPGTRSAGPFKNE